jgi:hypothetical protein
MQFGEPLDVRHRDTPGMSSLEKRTTEIQKQSKLLDEMLKDGGVNLMISLSENGGTAFQHEIINPKLVVQNTVHAMNNAFYNDSTYHNDNRNPLSFFQGVMQKNKINEAVTLVPRQTDVYEEKQELSAPKGLFRKRELVKTRVLVGNKPALHSAIVKGGKDEPAYDLIYKVFDDDRDNPLSFAYQDNTHREQIFELTITLPETEAKKALEQIKSDPTFIRWVADKAVIEQLGIPEEKWREGKKDNNGHPLRPPYEEWRRRHDGKSKMYFHETSKPIDLNNVKTF